MIEKIFIQQAKQKVKIEKFLEKELRNAGFTKVELAKTPLATRVIIYVARPSLAIGPGGRKIRELTNVLSRNYNLENPVIEIKQPENPLLDAKAQANRIARLLEKGFSWRSVSYKVVRDIVNAGAIGVELRLAGVLSGKGTRKRRQRIFVGYLKKVGGASKLVDFAKETAYLKQGAIGIKLRILKPGIIFEDKIGKEEIKKAIELIKEEKKEKDKEEQKEVKVDESKGVKETNE